MVKHHERYVCLHIANIPILWNSKFNFSNGVDLNSQLHGNTRLHLAHENNAKRKKKMLTFFPRPKQ